jgi:hypothetical protein
MSMNLADNNGQRYFTGMNLAMMSVYTLIYALYVWKYSAANRPYPEATLVIYGLLVPITLVLLLKYARPQLKLNHWNRVWLLAVAAIVVGLGVLMSRFDSASIEIGRYPALIEWVERLTAGEFPYRGGSKPSGFPFLFLLAAPFYYLGDVGLFQLFGLILFAAVLHFRYLDEPINRFRTLLLLAATPIFLFEVCVRSELIANAVLILATLEIVRHCHERPGRFTPVWLGLLLGLSASTRGIFMPAYLIVLPMFLLRHDWKYNLTFALALVGGFAGTLLPFICWDAASFFAYGPFSIQLSHIPSWLLVITLAASAGLGLTLKSTRQAYAATALVLFGIVLMKFVMSVVNNGLMATVIFDDHFDMAYFGFALPFLLIGLRLPPD